MKWHFGEEINKYVFEEDLSMLEEKLHFTSYIDIIFVYYIIFF